MGGNQSKPSVLGRGLVDVPDQVLETQEAGPPRGLREETFHSYPGCYSSGRHHLGPGSAASLANRRNLAGRASASPPQTGRGTARPEPCEQTAGDLRARRTYLLAESKALPPRRGPRATGVTLEPNKGPSELLSASDWRGRGGTRGEGGGAAAQVYPRAPCPAVPSRPSPAPSRKPPRWLDRGRWALPRTMKGFGRLGGRRASLPAPRPSPAPPDPARAPPECGLPHKSWNSRLGSDKEGPRQIDAAGKPNPSLVYVHVWGHRGAC